MRITILLGAMGLMAMGGCAVIYGYGEYEDAETQAPACGVAADCPGEDTECGIRACIEGRCYPIKLPGKEGSPINAQEPGDCLLKVCDDAGGIVGVPDDTDLPDDANECTDDSCAGGVAEHPPKSSGVPCGTGLTCDGNGACAGCTDPIQCPEPSVCKYFECTDATCVAHDSPEGTSCGPAAGCDMNGTYQPAWTCNEQGACNMPRSYSCELFACDVSLPDGCAVTCEGNVGCARGAMCEGDPPACVDCVLCGDWFDDPTVAGDRCPGSLDRITALRECACSSNGCGDECGTTPYCAGGSGDPEVCKNCMAIACLTAYMPCVNDLGHSSTP